MVLSRILLFKRLQCSRLNPIFLTPVSHRGFCCGFVVNPSPLCVTKGLSTLATGDTKTVEPKSLSSIFLNPSTDSQDKQTQCPSNDNTRKGKREEDKLPQNSRRSIYCPLQEKKSSMLLNPSAYSQVKKPQYLNPENSRKKMTEENKLPQVSKPFIFRSTQEKKFPKELSPGAALLLKTLCEELDLKQEPGQIPADFPSRHRLKSAAEKLGHSHQEIAKWLSGSGLKKVALFGCPSTERNTVFASKRLRSFFHIQEDVICRGCQLKSSCNFVNQRVNKVDRVILADVMRLLTVLAFDAVPQQLVVPADLKLSVDKLVKEAINLSQ